MQLNLLFTFILFRLKQIGRLLKDTGYFISAFLVIVFVIAFIGFSKLITEKNLLLIPVYLALCLPFHFRRKDSSFLLKLAIPQKTVWATEYNLLVLPFTIFLLYNLQWETALLGHVLATLIIFFPNSLAVKQRSYGNEQIVALIPNHLFEWRSLFRKRKFIFIICYLLTACLCFSIIAESIGILVLLSFLPEVYNRLEPKELIEVYPNKSSFLISKLKAHSLFIYLLFLPLYLLFAIFHYQFWYILAFLIILVELSISFCLLYKYSQGQASNPNVHSKLAFSIFFITSVLILPIGFILIYLYWRKAQKTLSGYATN